MTVKEIAELAGVSIGTVDRVLHGRGRVALETANRIQAIVDASSYTPNPLARNLKRSKPYRFCVLLPNRSEDSGYWAQAASGIEGAADELRTFNIETELIEFDRYEPDSFKRSSVKVHASKPDGLLLAPVMPEVAKAFIESLGDSIPYAFFDADLPGTSPLCSIGQDSFQGGQLAGRLAHLFANETTAPGGQAPLYAVLNAHSEDHHIRTRRDGFLQYAENRGMRTVVLEDIGMESDREVIKALKSLLSKEGDLTGVFVTSAPSHRIAEALLTLSPERHRIVIGYDLVEENIQGLREGRIDAIISQRPETQARRGLMDLYRAIVLGRTVEKRVVIPIDLYLKENLHVEGERG
ncbi:substrate-binding domain-containing protein [Treponema sp.]